MKLMIVFLLASILSVNAKVYSQLYTFSANSTALRDVIRTVEHQSSYRFFFSDDVADLNQIIRVDITDATVEQLLDNVLLPNGLGYMILENDLIIITPYANTKQSTVVTGIITDEAGESLPGVNVVVKGTTTGTISDVAGKYTLNVPAGDNVVLEYTFVGYQRQEMVVGIRQVIDIVLAESTHEIAEVVVTALGIKRDKKALGYAVQEVKGESMQKAKEPNVLSSMTGKVAGLSIKNLPGLFENPEISLRGNKDVLVVIDGVPRETNFWDVNSDDIEDMTVLKGPAAAALYGSRGKNGAIMITSKRGGGKEHGKLEVSINSSFMFQPNFVYLPKTQSTYGQGDWGKFAYVDGKGGGVNDSDVNSWGAKLDQADPTTGSGFLELPQWNSPIDPQTGERIPLPFISRGKNNIKNFFRTGNVISNNISLGSTNDRGDFRVSMTQLDQQGFDPNARLDATTISFSGSQRFTKLFTVDAALTYNKQYSENYPNTEYYSNNNMYNIMVWMSPDIDVRDLKQYWAPGKEGVEQRNYNYAYYNNPYYIANEFLQEYKKDVVYGYLKLLFDITTDLKLSVRSNVNWFNRYTAEKRPKGFVGWSPGYMNGGFYPENFYEFELNNEFLLTYDKTFNENWLVNAVFGGNNRNFNSRLLEASATSLSIPDVYNLGNSSVPVSAENRNIEKRVNSLYGSVNIGFKSMLYLSLTGRNDWSSALPKKNNSFFYPSVSLSGVISEMIEMPEFISFVKVRGAWIRVGGDMDPYSTRLAYSYGTVWNTTPSIYMGNTMYSENIEPDFKTTYELGLDLRFLQGMLGVDLTYYNDLESNMITDSPLSVASGYEKQKINSSKKTRRTGWELAITANPIRTADWNWNIGLNWSTSSKYLVRAEDGKDGYDGYTKEGRKYGNLFYTDDLDRSADGQVIYRDGLPQRTGSPMGYGNENPLWEAGFNNSLRYKNFSFSFSIDGRWGGLIYSRLNQKLWESGKHYDSANGEAATYRDADNRGEATYIGKGLVVTSGEVMRDSHGNVTSDTREYAPNEQAVYYRDWANRNYHTNVWGTNTFDATYFKLREVVISYRIPQTVIKKTFLKSAEVSLIGRNLYLWTKEDGNIDPDIMSGSGSGYRLYVPTPRNIGFNIKLNF